MVLSPSQSLQTRLTFAFASLTLLILISLVFTVYKSDHVDVAVEEIVEESVPIAFSGGQLASDVNASMAALRGWVLTSDENFKTQRADLWSKINATITSLNESLGEADYWVELRTELGQFQKAQNQVEATAHSDKDQPATQLLNTQVTPLTDDMLSSISQAYIEEISLEATPLRKEMLGQMGDIRGALAVVTGNMRAYLLTGQQHYADQYGAVWGWAMGRLDELRSNDNLLSETQKGFINQFFEAAQKVTPLFDQLVEIRASDDWNQSRKMLVVDVIPLANSILMRLTNPETGLVAAKQTDVENAGNRAISATSELNATAYILAFLGIGLSIFMIALSSRTIIKPVHDMTEAMAQLSKGASNVEIPGQERQDEIGQMAQALQVFKVNSEERLRLESEQSEQQKQLAERAKRIESLSFNFDETIRQMLTNSEQATGLMKQSAQSLQNTATRTLEETRSASGASRQTQQNVDEVAQATGALSDSFVQISENARSSVQAIEQAITQGEEASKTVNWMSEAAARIGEVVQMIEDIAAQTNLLALNATIEAARAGEAGKGFAVVAGEVKNLANQTARATQEITEHIQRMQQTTEQSVQAIEEVCETISNVGNQASGVRDTVAQQSEATQGISANIDGVADHSRSIADNIQHVETAAEETNSAANEVLGAVDEMTVQTSKLKEEVESFLSNLKSA